MSSREQPPVAARQASARRDGMSADEEVSLLRASIVETRRDLGETVEALADKADSITDVRGRVEEQKRALREATDRAQHRVAAQAGRRQTQSVAAAMAVAILALAILRRRRG
ncbi:MAG: MYXO-CTERM sorting domain-containing protein [Thermoleophilaceae bacterium]